MRIFAAVSGKNRRTPVSFALILAGIAFLSFPAYCQCDHSRMKSPFDGMTGGPYNRGFETCFLDVSSATCGGSACGQDPPAMASDKSDDNASVQPVEKKSSRVSLPDFNRDIYYRNKLEFSLDGGWLPIDIPFPFNVFEGDPYDLYPLRYTLVPIIASLRWHVDGIGGRWIFRGNWDVTFSASATAIPRGAETHYFSYDMGVRRNFVPRNSRVAPYVDIRLGMGLIDAKGPLGIYYAQGQNFTFTANMGSGMRYNFSPRCGISAGLNWMHISNNNLSAPAYSNYGINVYGPMFGFDWTLRPRARGSQ